MIRKIFALGSLLCLIGSAAQAAPVVLEYNAATGAVKILNLTGEIGWAFRAPEAKLLKANAPSSGGAVTIDKGTDNEIGGANFAGFQGTFDLGLAALPGIPRSELGFFVQVDFVNTVDYPVGSTSADPLPGQGGIVRIVPEPASVGLAGMGLIGLAARRRRS